MKEGDLINLYEENSLCPKCNKCNRVLDFKWDGLFGDNKSAICCGKEYIIERTNIYKVMDIKNI